jgi:hypothetical protein
VAEEKVKVIQYFTGKKTLAEVLKEIILLQWKNK